MDAAPKKSGNTCWRDLLEKFLACLDVSARWLDTWAMFLSDPHYDAELDRCARRVLRRWDANWHDQIAQEARMRLERHLRQTPDLGFDRTHPESFPAWLGAVISNDCRNAYRAIRKRQRKEHQVEELPERAAAEVPLGLALDLQMAIAALEPSVRAAMVPFSRGYSVAEIAARLEVSYKRAYVLVQRGKQRLRDQMRDPATWKK